LSRHDGKGEKTPDFIAGIPDKEKDLLLKKIPVVDDFGVVIGLANSEEEARKIYTDYRKNLDLQ